MKNLPTDYYQIESQNKDQFMKVLNVFDPDLYYIKFLLDELNINPKLIPPLIKVLCKVATGSGYGTIRIFMEDGVVTQIKPEESNQVNVRAVTIKEEVRVE